MAYSGAIDGIISGMDTTKIIETMLKIDQQQVDIYSAKQAEQTNKLTTWQSIEAMLMAFKAQASLLANDSLWYSKSVTSSDDTIMAATSTNNASPGHYFFSVNQLATNHQIASQGFNIATQNIGTGTIQIKLGSGATKILTIDSSNNTLTGLKDTINNANFGVSAAIISDGSYSNSYRLILTAKESGASNQITVTPALSGGISPNFNTARFDVAEKIGWNGSATSSPVVSTAASYTGSANKTYTFTVGGTGLQTVGTAPITINWTDGTNSGSFDVATADTDVALTGTGADGLSMHFSVGSLNAGDTFQVQTFAPTIQRAQDAIVQMGNPQSGSSPITVTSPTNSLTNLIQGVTLDIKNMTTVGQQVQIDIADDRSKVKDQITNFISKFNDYQTFVDKQFSYTPGAGNVGVLLGDGSLLTMHNDIRSTLTHVFEGRSSQLRTLSQAGIKFNSSGKLGFDSAVFDKMADSNFSDMVKLFKSDGTSDKTFIQYDSSSSFTKVKVEGYKVDITEAAARGTFRGISIDNPSVTNLVIGSTNNAIKIKVNNSVSGLITLSPKTYTSGTDLAQDIENAINSDSSLSALGVDVEWSDNGNRGYLTIYTREYGSKAAVTIDDNPGATGHTALGLIGGFAQIGQNVEGTINGEKAKGEGQYLTGDHSNATTADLKLKITATPDQIISGAEGTVFFNKGIAALMDDKLSRYTDNYNGIIKTKSDSVKKTIDGIAVQVKKLQDQQERKRASLYQQFMAMEEALARLQSEQQSLTAMLGGSTSSASSTPTSSASSRG